MALIRGLRVERQWAGPALQAYATHAAWNALYHRSWGDPPLDAFIEYWLGRR